MCDLRKLGDLSGPKCHWGMLAQFLPHSFTLMVKEAPQAEPTIQLSQGECPTPLSPGGGGAMQASEEGGQSPTSTRALILVPLCGVLTM